jgi:hypothetical protein
MCLVGKVLCVNYKCQHDNVQVQMLVVTMVLFCATDHPGAGFSQSLSGSETDVSTSNENLSHEERYVIRHTARQEPQGQENLSSNRSSLDVSSSSYNTLIIHGVGDEPWTGRYCVNSTVT